MLETRNGRFYLAAFKVMLSLQMIPIGSIPGGWCSASSPAAAAAAAVATFSADVSQPLGIIDVSVVRLRRWIESRSATNVVDCRPVLNAEIQRGVALKKTNSVNDRSAPRFWRTDAMTSRQAAFFKWFQMSYLGPVQNGETCWSNTSATIKFSSYSYFR